jgi:hypothetical protein
VVLLIAVVIALLIGFLSGGSLRHASAIRIRYLPFLIAALLVQVALFTPIIGTRQFIFDVGPYIYIGTLLVTLAVMLRNLQIPGMPVIALGGLLNALVIIANGGRMPSPESALREAGLLQRVRDGEQAIADGESVFTNSTVTDDDTRLGVLGDIIAIPDINVISIGDILIAVGAAIAIDVVMRRKPAETQPVDSVGASS